MSQDHELIKRVEARLDRLEDGIKQLTEATVSLARIEEKMIAQQDSITRIHNRVDELERKCNTLEGRVESNSWVVTRAERLFWIIVAAALGASAWFSETFLGK